MTIHLSEPLYRWAERHAAAGGLTVGEYVERLVARERAATDPDAVVRDLVARPGEDPSQVSAERLAAGKQRLESLLIEGLDSGEPIPVDAAFWEERRRVLRERLTARQGGEAGS